jgi:hypothetical protein
LQVCRKVLADRMQWLAGFLQPRHHHCSSQGWMTMVATAAGSISQGLLYNQLNQQASLIGFMDCFRMMAIVALIGIPLALATKSFRPGGEASGGH